MGLIEEGKDGIVSFALFKVERGREKICKCNPPHYVIDTVNRIVTCEDCGATIDAFDALKEIAVHIESLEEYQIMAKRRAKVYAEDANREYDRILKNRAFRDMSEHYKNGLFPICPDCGKAFDPKKINRWTRI